MPVEHPLLVGSREWYTDYRLGSAYGVNLVIHDHGEHLLRSFVVLSHAIGLDSRIVCTGGSAM